MDIQPQGNRSVLKILERLSANKKIPHAYIFSGREGIGKKLYALFFAKMLNCLAEKGQKPCNVCSNCIKLGKNIHPDIKIISTDKKQIKVEEIKSAISFTNSSPIEGRYKFIIIDDAHKMNQFSSNSLLKTLEEPLSDSIFILITDNDKNLLPTILSRCVKISFGPLTEKELEEILIQKGYRKEQIFQIVPYANGSVKIAEDLLKEKNFELLNDILEILEKIRNIRFLELSAISEKISLNNFEETAFSIMAQYFYKRIKNGEEDFFPALSCYEKVVNFKRFLRYNIGKSFILEALFLSLSTREEI